MCSCKYALAGILPVGSFSIMYALSLWPHAQAAKATAKPWRAQPVFEIRMLLLPTVLFVLLAELSIVTMV